MTTSSVSINIPDDLLLKIDAQVFERRKQKAGARTASRTAVIVDLLRQAVREVSQ